MLAPDLLEMKLVMKVRLCQAQQPDTVDLVLLEILLHSITSQD